MFRSSYRVDVAQAVNALPPLQLFQQHIIFLVAFSLLYKMSQITIEEGEG